MQERPRRARRSRRRRRSNASSRRPRSRSPRRTRRSRRTSRRRRSRGSDSSSASRRSSSTSGCSRRAKAEEERAEDREGGARDDGGGAEGGRRARGEGARDGAADADQRRVWEHAAVPGGRPQLARQPVSERDQRHPRRRDGAREDRAVASRCSPGCARSDLEGPSSCRAEVDAATTGRASSQLDAGLQGAPLPRRQREVAPADDRRRDAAGAAAT